MRSGTVPFGKCLPGEVVDELDWVNYYVVTKPPMRKPPTPVETDFLCYYGCGSVAKFLNRSGNYMCLQSNNSCPALKARNSEATKEAYKSGKRGSQRELYHSLSEEVKARMRWNKGLTKENNESVRAYSEKLKGRPGVSRPHTEEAKAKMSRIRTEWLKKSENRANIGRHKRSWMELTFEKYLKQLVICDYESEKHFWSPTLEKNFFVDFIFESKKLIVELDGTQHRLTTEKDIARDNWFRSIGYEVVRVDVYEFRRRHFSREGFLDILGC